MDPTARMTVADLRVGMHFKAGDQSGPWLKVAELEARAGTVLVTWTDPEGQTHTAALPARREVTVRAEIEM